MTAQDSFKVKWTERGALVYGDFGAADAIELAVLFASRGMYKTVPDVAEALGAKAAIARAENVEPWRAEVAQGGR